MLTRKHARDAWDRLWEYKNGFPTLRRSKEKKRRIAKPRARTISLGTARKIAMKTLKDAEARRKKP